MSAEAGHEPATVMGMDREVQRATLGLEVPTNNEQSPPQAAQFTVFPKLPRELQYKIWRDASPEPTVVDVTRLLQRQLTRMLRNPVCLFVIS